jgi:flagellar basal-body rod modification protein FlgD
MAATDIIGGGSSAQQAAAVPAQPVLGQDEFLKIFLAQLQYQDPLKPLDNQQFLAQMAQFSALAQTSQMNDRINSLLAVQSATQSIGLIGRTVQIQTSSAQEVGTVTSLSFNSGDPNLTVTKTDGEILTGITLSQIQLVR